MPVISSGNGQFPFSPPFSRIDARPNAIAHASGASGSPTKAAPITRCQYHEDAHYSTIRTDRKCLDRIPRMQHYPHMQSPKEPWHRTIEIMANSIPFVKGDVLECGTQIQKTADTTITLPCKAKVTWISTGTAPTGYHFGVTLDEVIDDTEAPPRG